MYVVGDTNGWATGSILVPQFNEIPSYRLLTGTLRPNEAEGDGSDAGICGAFAGIDRR